MSHHSWIEWHFIFLGVCFQEQLCSCRWWMNPRQRCRHGIHSVFCFVQSHQLCAKLVQRHYCSLDAKYFSESNLALKKIYTVAEHSLYEKHKLYINNSSVADLLLLPGICIYVNYLLEGISSRKEQIFIDIHIYIYFKSYTLFGIFSKLVTTF